MRENYQSIRISTEEAASIARSNFDLEGQITVLPGDQDFNFRLKTEKLSCVLKVSRPGQDITSLEFESEILSYLRKSDEHVIVPDIIPDRSGHKLSEWNDHHSNIRKVRLLTWIEGRVWSAVHPISESLLNSLGQKAGKLTFALKGFDSPAARRQFDWDLASGEWTRQHLHLFNPEQQKILLAFLDDFMANQNSYQLLRKGVVQNDANDNNIIVTNDLLHPEVKAIIDFGDSIYTQIVNDLAITLAYAVMAKPDPLNAAIPVIKGYHSQMPLLEEELEFLYNLVAMRLVISVTKAALNKKAEPENAYLHISEKPAWEVLERWSKVNKEFALYNFRLACNYPPHQLAASFLEWAGSFHFSLSSLFPTLGKDRIHPVDLSVSGVWLGHQMEFEDLEMFQFKLKRLQDAEPGSIIAGGYMEPRTAYTTTAYEKTGNHGTENRTVHLGVDFWIPEGTPVHALIQGTVIVAVNDAGDKEYGGLVILQHHQDKLQFFSLHGHLDPQSIKKLAPGARIQKGDLIGIIGSPPENGNWAPHLHFQILLDTLGYIKDFPGVAYPAEMSIWRSICPDPNLLFKQPELEAKKELTISETLTKRKKHLGRSLSISYSDPLKMVRGAGAYLFDHLGRKYLDTVNNVAHVGHEHPRIVKAGQEQMAVLNTNTRYLHDRINEFAEKLLATLPKELSVIHFVNSGSEANELALRMARAYTGHQDMIAMEVGYHGNTGACVDVSSYKFDGKGGSGQPEHTHIVPLPDSYRGLYRGADSGPEYAGHVLENINLIQSRGRGLAGFICESIISCGGQIELPDRFLELAYKSVRDAGGLCIADEVQVGCGRVGSTFWGFQLFQAVPDIVTIGKPIGNGHPLAAVVCTTGVAESFAKGMEYFNTFGGNPVSCAIGLEVLKVIEEEGLQKHALQTGQFLKEELTKMQKQFPIMGDIRGQGLFLGIELADEQKNPLTDQAVYLANRMRELGILMSTDGKDNNVLKIKPPMVFSQSNAIQLLETLYQVFQEDFMTK